MLVKILKSTVITVWRNRRRSLLTLTITCVSFLAVNFYMGYIRSTADIMMTGMVHGDYGHLQIYAAGTPKELVLAQEGNYGHMLSPDAVRQIRAVLKTHPEVGYVTSRVNLMGMAGTENGSQMFRAEALPPRDGMDLYVYLPITGDFISDERPDDVVVGKKLADALGVGIGDPLMLMATSSLDSMEAMNARVAGLYNLGSDYVDRYKLYIHADAVRNLTLTDGTDKLIVLLESNDDMPRMKRALEAEFLERGIKADCYSFYDIATYYNQLMETLNGQLYVALSILLLVVFFGLVNNLYMSATDRIDEFATMRTIGISRTVTFLMIVCEGFLLVGGGVLFSSLLLRPLESIVNRIRIQVPPPPGSSRGYPFVVAFDGPGLLKTALAFAAMGLLGGLPPGLRVVRMNIQRGFHRDLRSEEMSRHRIRMARFPLAVPLLIRLWAPGPAWAGDPAGPEARRILDLIARHEAAYRAYAAEITMTSRKGEAEARQSGIRAVFCGNNSVLEYVQPDIDRGKIILQRQNDYYLYFPSTKKYMKMSFSSKLMGGVSYGDIAAPPTEVNYRFSGLESDRDESGNPLAKATFVLKEGVFGLPYYGKTIYCDMEKGVIRKVESYSRSGILLGTLKNEEFREMGGILVPVRVVLYDALKTNETVTMETLSMKAVNPASRLFNPEYLPYAGKDIENCFR